MKAERLKLVYVPGSVNEYRIWTSEDNFPRDQSEAAGIARANKINRLVAKARARHTNGRRSI